MKKSIWTICKILAVLYVSVCILLYVFQEKLIFFPEKLDRQYQFGFDRPFKEFTITTKDNKKLNALLFTTDSAKGLIFYLHGNAGALNSWGDVAKTYTGLQYDVFMPDYRGYGKSEGSINGQDQIFTDVQTAYDTIKKLYKEDKIIVLGYSIGTGPAAKLASANNPRLLILQAPYYSLTDMMQHSYPGVPTFILKYKFETNEYITRCKMPVVIFHGDADEVIYYGSSLKLKAKFKQQDTLITLTGQGHNGITENPGYVQQLQKILAQ